MTPLYTQEEFNNAGYRDKLLLKCEFCNNPFLKQKEQIVQALKPNPKKKYNFCSHDCYSKSIKKLVEIPCSNCGKIIKTTPQRVKRVKHNFCSRSCNGFYQSQHKSKGTKRSKLEVWIEEQLTQLYPNLHIDYNKTSAIGSELDIYIPSLNIAFELNGIFHYEPIFGEKKLNQTKNKDQYKFKSCIDNQIDLCVIDTSGQKYFKVSTSKKYLDIITNIINQRTI